MKIEDKEFLISLANFNVEWKFNVSKLSVEYLQKNKCKKGYYVSVWLNLIEYYIQLTEIILMILYSQKNRKEQNTSFLFQYSKLNIKEDKGKFSSEKILEEIKNQSLKDFITFFHLEFLTQNLNTTTPEQLEEMKLIFGGHEGMQEQYLKEFQLLKVSLEKIISNRLVGKEDGFPYYKLYNKIKHGSTFMLNNSEEMSILFFENVVSESNESSNCNIIKESCTQSNIATLLHQVETIKNITKHLIHSIYLSI